MSVDSPCGVTASYYIVCPIQLSTMSAILVPENILKTSRNPPSVRRIRHPPALLAWLPLAYFSALCSVTRAVRAPRAPVPAACPRRPLVARPAGVSRTPGPRRVCKPSSSSCRHRRHTLSLVCSLLRSTRRNPVARFRSRFHTPAPRPDNVYYRCCPHRLASNSPPLATRRLGRRRTARSPGRA
jgi:hypothetical protein